MNPGEHTARIERSPPLHGCDGERFGGENSSRKQRRVSAR